MVEGPVGTAVGPVAPPVEGGRPGAGNLFLKGFGAGEVTIPMSVTGR